MLSSQTKDPVTHEATMNLRRNLQGGLCLEGILSASDEEIHVGRTLFCVFCLSLLRCLNLQQCINKVGFWRRKTDYIKRTAEILRDKVRVEVASSREWFAYKDFAILRSLTEMFLKLLMIC